MARERPQATGGDPRKEVHPGHLPGGGPVRHVGSAVVLRRQQGRVVHAHGRREGLQPDGGEAQRKLDRLSMLLRILRRPGNTKITTEVIPES